MTNDQQAIAEALIRQKRMLRAPLAIARYYFRKAVFQTPVRHLIKLRGKNSNDISKFWDDMLSNTTWSTYLGGTIEVDWRNSLVINLIRYLCPGNAVVLDVGCAAGSLASALGPVHSYTGVDASKHAVERAQQANTSSSFIVSDLRDFPIPPQPTWDAIVFNEVLYYLDVDEAVAQVARYADGLRPRGVLIVSMKDDAKSHAIFHKLRKHYIWRDGILWQRKPFRPQYSLNISRETPAFLIGALTTPADG